MGETDQSRRTVGASIAVGVAGVPIMAAGVPLVATASRDLKLRVGVGSLALQF